MIHRYEALRVRLATDSYLFSNNGQTRVLRKSIARRTGGLRLFPCPFPRVGSEMSETVPVASSPQSQGDIGENSDSFHTSQHS